MEGEEERGSVGEENSQKDAAADETSRQTERSQTEVRIKRVRLAAAGKTAGHRRGHSGKFTGSEEEEG